MSERAQYVECPKGHKIFVVWSDELQRFGFTCDECGQHAIRAASVHGVIEVKIVARIGRT